MANWFADRKESIYEMLTGLIIPLAVSGIMALVANYYDNKWQNNVHDFEKHSKWLMLLMYFVFVWSAYKILRYLQRGWRGF